MSAQPKAPATGHSQGVGCGVVGRLWAAFGLAGVVGAWVAEAFHRPGLGDIVQYGILSAVFSLEAAGVARARARCGRSGVSWPGQRDPLPWEAILDIERRGRRWVLLTSDGERVLPRFLPNVGEVVDCWRRAQASAEASVGAERTMALADCPSGRVRVVHSRELATDGPTWAVAAALLALLAFGLAVDNLVIWPMALIGLLGSAVALVGSRTGPLQPIRPDGLLWRDTALPWTTVAQVTRRHNGLQLLFGTGQEVDLAADEATANALAERLERVVADRARLQAQWDKPSDASLSPAARLTADEDRGLSAAAYGATGLPAGDSAEPPAASATRQDAH